MGCSSSPYVNLSNLAADGCCNLLAANELQFMSKEYYQYMAPFIMNQVDKVASEDAFGKINKENKALDVLMDIHMLYGYLLSVQYQREWDAELDTVCHHDFGNLYYWNTYDFECIAQHFMCYNLDIIPALKLFNIDKTPLRTNGIGFMHITVPPTPDCAIVNKTCIGPPVALVQSVSLEDILIDNVSISPAPHAELTMTALLDYAKGVIEGLYPVEITIQDNGGDNYDITICAAHNVEHPTTIEIVTEYHFLPPLVPGASFVAISGTGDPCFVQFNFPFGTPIPGIASISLRDIFWASPADDILINTPTFYPDMCAVAADVLAYLNVAYPGVYSLVSCGGLAFRLANATCVDIIVGVQINQYIQPPEDIQQCNFLSENIIGGQNANEETNECPDDNNVFHVS